MNMTMKTCVAVSVLIAAAVIVCSGRRLNPRMVKSRAQPRVQSREQDVVQVEEPDWRDPSILERMFRLADRNNDSFVNITEHMNFFLGTPGEQFMSPLQFYSMFQAADSDNNKHVTLEELDLFREREWKPHMPQERPARH